MRPTIHLITLSACIRSKFFGSLFVREAGPLLSIDFQIARHQIGSFTNPTPAWY